MSERAKEQMNGRAYHSKTRFCWTAFCNNDNYSIKKPSLAWQHNVRIAYAYSTALHLTMRQYPLAAASANTGIQVVTESFQHAGSATADRLWQVGRIDPIVWLPNSSFTWIELPSDTVNRLFSGDIRHECCVLATYVVLGLHTGSLAL